MPPVLVFDTVRAQSAVASSCHDKHCHQHCTRVRGREGERTRPRLPVVSLRQITGDSMAREPKILDVDTRFSDLVIDIGQIPIPHLNAQERRPQYGHFELVGSASRERRASLVLFRSVTCRRSSRECWTSVVSHRRRSVRCSEESRCTYRLYPRDLRHERARP